MGALGGTLTVTRFYVDGEIPIDFKDLFISRLERHAFKPLDPSSDIDETVGWVNTFDPFSTAFVLNDVLWGNYLLATIRHDAIRLPATAFKLHLKKAMQDYMKKTGKERLSRAETDEIRDQLEKQLKKQMLPSIRTYDVVWNMDRQCLWLWSTNKKVKEQFLELFEESFEMSLHEQNPFMQLKALGFEKELLDSLTQLEPASLSAAPRQM